MNAVVARKALALVEWEPWDYTAAVAQPAYSLQQIIAGTYDAYIHQWARGAAACGEAGRSARGDAAGRGGGSRCVDVHSGGGPR